MSNPWFRMYAEFSHDPKIQMLSEAMQRRYVMLMCMRCSNTLVTLHETEVAFHLRISNEEMAETKALFIAKGFIDKDFNLLNWEKRQFASDTSNARVAKHRALQKEKQSDDGNADVTLPKRNVNALDTDTDTDTDLGAKAPLPSAVPDCPHEILIDLFEKQLPNLAQPKKSLWRAGKNAPAMKARWRWVMTAAHEKGERTGQRLATSKDEGIAWFERYFAYVARSEFLTGASSDWACDLGWLINAANFEKVLAGNYENKLKAVA